MWSMHLRKFAPCWDMVDMCLIEEIELVCLDMDVSIHAERGSWLVNGMYIV